MKLEETLLYVPTKNETRRNPFICAHKSETKRKPFIIKVTQK